MSQVRPGSHVPGPYAVTDASDPYMDPDGGETGIRTLDTLRYT